MYKFLSNTRTILSDNDMKNALQKDLVHDEHVIVLIHYKAQKVF